MPELACVNGSFCPISEARVSVEDRGFQFGDGVYEVIVFHGSHAVLLDDHLRRLRASCRAIGLEIDFRALELEALIREGVRRAALPATLAYLQITRGTAPRQHAFDPDLVPTVVMTFRAAPEIPAARRAAGLSVRAMTDERWARCHIKSTGLLANVLARNAATRAGFDDVLFLGPGGEVREASAANVFAIRDGVLHTPPEDHAILPGITRRWVLDCARRLGMSVRESRLSLDALCMADEVFLSSSTIELLAVVRVDARVVGNGRPGPLGARIHATMRADLQRGEFELEAPPAGVTG